MKCPHVMQPSTFSAKLFLVFLNSSFFSCFFVCETICVCLFCLRKPPYRGSRCIVDGVNATVEDRKKWLEYACDPTSAQAKKKDDDDEPSSSSSSSSSSASTKQE